MSQKAKYNRRTWMNGKKSAFSGSIICYDGTFLTDNGKRRPWSFVEIADCHVKCRIHLGNDNDKRKFTRKVRKMRDELNLFLEHLEKED